MQRAFSLVELSIVLVILGLLTGGILAGQSLIRAAELRAQLRDFESLKSAHYSFRDKYLCMPGDCANIAQFFPAIANGNGDGRVDIWPVTGTNEGITYNEAMESAGLIEPRRISAAVEYRGARVNNGFSYMHFTDRYAGGGYTPATLLGQGHAWINLANWNTPFANGPVLKPEDAWNFDVKIDDARPYTGLYMSANAGVGGAYNATCINGSAEYMLDTSSVTCRSFYKVE